MVDVATYEEGRHAAVMKEGVSMVGGEDGVAAACQTRRRHSVRDERGMLADKIFSVLNSLGRRRAWCKCRICRIRQLAIFTSLYERTHAGITATVPAGFVTAYQW